MSEWKLAKPGYESLGQEKKEGCRRALRSCFPSLGWSSTWMFELFYRDNNWGGVGQVPRAQHFSGAPLCPWDAPLEVEAVCNCSCPPWELGFEQRKSYRALMLITLK